ncbi:MAG: glycosyltransferase family 9 protein [Planctomycetota bacterium]
MALKFNKILIVRLSAIGDVINTIPALVVLKHNFPLSHISWVVEDKAKDLLLGYPYLDNVFILKRRSGNRISRALSLIRKLRESKFDVAIDFQGNLKSGLVASLSGATTRIGIKPAKECNTLFTNYKINLPDQRMNRVERNLYILKSLGLDINILEWSKIPPPFTKPDELYIDKFLSVHNPQEKPVVILHPGTSEFGIFKRWHPQKYAQLADRLIESLNICCIISWSGKEKKLAESISARMKHKPLIIDEAISINKFAALIKHALLFIGSDSAPLHLANLLGINIIGLYGPKDPIIYGPYSPATYPPEADLPMAQSSNQKTASDKTRSTKPVIISAAQKGISCSPCRKRKCNNPICMESITVEEIFQQSSTLLLK